MTKNTEKKNNNLGYSFYSRVLNKPFDSLSELTAAEAEYYEAQKAKEDAAAKKKADATKVEEAYKALNAARKTYKEELTQLTKEYAESLDNLKKAFDLGKQDLHNTLKAADDHAAKVLKEFTDTYGNYHFTIKGDDFETTFSGSTSTGKAVPKASDIFDIFDWMFKF
jgi:chromosome segregation ATPase